MSSEDLQQNKNSSLDAFISDDSIRKLLCQVCYNYLSVAPVYHIEDIGFTCGRCENVQSQLKSNPKKERQWLYETLACDISFPCVNEVNGCDVKLKWAEVEVHEEVCHFAKISCFFADNEYFENDDNEKCDWLGDYDELNDHLEEDHESEFVDLPIKINVKNNIMKKREKRKLILTRVDGEVGVAILQFDKLFYCTVMTFLERKVKRNTEFMVQIIDGDNILSSTSSRHKIIPKCSVSASYLENIRVKIIDMSFFEVLSDESYISLDLGTTLNNITKNASRVFKNVLCKLCEKKIYPPFYICLWHHKICQACIEMKKPLVCPECGKSCTVRNFFDEINEFSNNECKNKNEGCSYVDDITNIKRHESICTFNIVKCAFSKCEWQGSFNESFARHIELEHYFLELNKFNRISNTHSNKTFHVGYFQFDDQVFSHERTHINGYLCFSFSYLTQQTLTASYMVELNIESNSQQNTSKLCLQYFIKPSYVEKEDRMMKIPKDFLQNFFRPEDLLYSINFCRL